MASAEDRHREESRRPVLKDAQRKRILIADDHEVTRRGIRSLIADEPNLEICGEAADGLEAVARAKELQPDLIILDLIMPRAGGFSAAYKIRECGLLSKILVFTTHAYPGLERILRASGCNGYVLKGHASEDLIRAIRAALADESELPTKRAPHARSNR